MQNLPKGALLFAERPIVAVLNEDQLGHYCSYCYNPLTEPKNDRYDTFCSICNDIGAKELYVDFAGIRNQDC